MSFVLASKRSKKALRPRCSPSALIDLPKDFDTGMKALRWGFQVYAKMTHGVQHVVSLVAGRSPTVVVLTLQPVSLIPVSKLVVLRLASSMRLFLSSLDLSSHS